MADQTARYSVEDCKGIPSILMAHRNVYAAEAVAAALRAVEAAMAEIHAADCPSTAAALSEWGE